jgi:hypothetical protein
MDEQNTRVETDRMSGDGQGNGSSRERRSGDAAGNYRSAHLDDGRTTPPAATGVGFDPPAPAPPAPEQRTREIRAEIAQTREDLSETVNAIQDRLSPRNIASNAADSVKQAASDTARDIAESDSVQYVRSNPVPTAMVGIGIAGLAWLFLAGRDASDYSRSYAARGRRRMAGSAYDPYYPDERASSGAASARSNRSSAFGGADPYGRRGAGASDFASRGSAMAADLGREARVTTRRVQSRLQQTWNESPLLMGAAAAVVGAMVGMAVPETERENEWLGETRDSMVEEVQQTVRETVSKVQDAATAAVGLGADQESGRQQQMAGDQERRETRREDFGR